MTDDKTTPSTATLTPEEETAWKAWNDAKYDKVNKRSKGRVGFIDEETLEKDKKEVLERGKKITSMLTKLEKTQDEIWAQTVSYRRCFFWTIITILISSILVGWILIFSVGLCSDGGNSYVLILSAFGTMLTSIITLPRIIARHLFPESMNDSWVKLILGTLEQDMKIREYYIDNDDDNDDL